MLACIRYHVVMIRTQIQFTADQMDALRRTAAAHGKSIAQVVREAVDAQLRASDREARWSAAESFIGKFADREGATDVALRHDHYLALAFEEDLHRAHQPESEVAEPGPRKS